tara:strand:- start:682 stop:927 length:246 start_codon:yes stop_codon:yes gene_type:complete
MAFSKTFTSYDATVYGMLLSILAPNEKDSKKAEKLAGQIANGCNEKEIDRAMNLVDSIMELVQLETTRARNDNKSWESEVE